MTYPVKLKKNQMGCWCTFCEPKTTRALYRPLGWNTYDRACEEHKHLLIIKEDDRITEADYQTWMKL